MTDNQNRPFLRIVRGDPDDAELAALTVVLAAAAAAPESAPAPERRSRWADRARLLHHAPHPGDGAWRASGFPR